MMRKVAYILLAAAALSASARAQEPRRDAAASADDIENPQLRKPVWRDSTVVERFEHEWEMRERHLLDETMQRTAMPLPEVEVPPLLLPRIVTSSVAAPNLPRNIYVTGMFPISTYWSLSISNGNSANLGPRPGANLDARTLSFPMPR